MTHHEELAKIKKDYCENCKKTLEALKKLRKECVASNSYCTQKEVEKLCNDIVKAAIATI